MPHDHDGHHEAAQEVPRPRRAATTTRNTDWRDRFSIPEPVKRVFARFPLVTYPANQLPVTSPTQRHEHSLWIWTTAEGAATGAPSFNPSCLKWQVCRPSTDTLPQQGPPFTNTFNADLPQIQTNSPPHPPIQQPRLPLRKSPLPPPGPNIPKPPPLPHLLVQTPHMDLRQHP